MLNTTFDHTSVLSMVINCFGLPKGKLGKRQTAAPDASEALTLPTLREDRPRIPRMSVSVWKELQSEMKGIFHSALHEARTKPLNPLQKTIINGVAQHLGQFVELKSRLSGIENAVQADAL